MMRLARLRLSKTAGCCVFFTAIVVLFAYQAMFREYGLSFSSPPWLVKWLSSSKTGENVDFRRDLASQLADITRTIKTHMECVKSAHMECVKPDLLLQLNHVIGQLDPRHAQSNSILLATPEGHDPDTCGEEYLGTRHGYPFFSEGFVRMAACNKSTDVSQLVTAVFHDTGPAETIHTVLKSVRDTHPNLPVVVASNNKHSENISHESIHWFVTKQNYKTRKPLSLGNILNSMIKSITTPYVLLGINTSYFSNLTRLERQIYVISSMSSVGIAGGAFRNESGHWKVGCHLSQIRNYFLKYTEGYKYSAKDCMFCDFLEGPFVAKRSILQQILFKEDLPNEVVFHDWFLRVKDSGVLVMNCPDVMYFTQGPVEKVRSHESRAAWLSLAEMWQIVRVLAPSRALFTFSCRELKLSCKPSSWNHADLMPLCCLSEIAGALRALDGFALENSVDYEIEAGTLLGAVKLRSFLPWDKDGDINFLSKDYQTFLNNSNVFSKQGYRLDKFEKDQYFTLNTPNIKFEMWGSETLSTFNLPAVMQDKPTLIKMVGVWVRTVWSPGLFARNRYGPDYLKHVQHWIELGSNTGWLMYNPGSWLPCTRRGHHSCLDQYPADGSVGFVPEE